MAALSPEESALVKATQEELAKAKDALQNAAINARKMMLINHKAGRAVEANAAMRLQGALISARGDIIQAHADVSDALVAAYDDGGDIVVMGGGAR